MSATPLRMGSPKDSMEGRKLLPAGRYQVRLDGFKQKLSKEKPGKDRSVNFNPQLKVVNHPSLNGELIYTPLNQQVGFILEAFSHMLGHELEEVGDSMVLPGTFTRDPQDANNIQKMQYRGPLLSQVGELELGVNKSPNNKDQNYIKQFFCRVPNCQKNHPTELT